MIDMRDEIEYLHRQIYKLEGKLILARKANELLAGAIRTALYETSDMTEMERVLEEALDA